MNPNIEQEHEQCFGRISRSNADWDAFVKELEQNVSGDVQYIYWFT